MGKGLKVSNYFFIGLFTFEALSKIIAYGFVLAPKTYLRNGKYASGCIHATLCISCMLFWSSTMHVQPTCVLSRACTHTHPCPAHLCKLKS